MNIPMMIHTVAQSIPNNTIAQAVEELGFKLSRLFPCPLDVPVEVVYVEHVALDNGTVIEIQKRRV